MSTELTLKKQATSIAIPNQPIQTKEQAQEATLILSQANKVLDAIIAEEEKITVPANAVIKAERARWAESKGQLKDTIATLRAKLSAYQTLSIAKQREEEAKIAARIAPGKGNLSVETAIKKMSEIDRAEDKIETEAGSISYRTKQTLKITNKDLIQKEYMLPDEDLILEQLKNGITIPGCEIEIIQVPINSRR